jgi:hypothetical protein
VEVAAAATCNQLINGIVAQFTYIIFWLNKKYNFIGVGLIINCDYVTCFLEA